VNSLFYAFGAVFLVPFSAFAVPAGFNNTTCGALTLKNTSTSSLLPDTEDCSLVHVLPPIGGQSKIQSFSPSGNLGFCPAMKTLHGAVEKVAKQYRKLTSKASELDPMVEEASIELKAAKKKAAEFLATGATLEISKLEGMLRQVDIRIEAIIKQLETCSHTNCAPLTEELSAKNLERSDLQERLFLIQDKNSEELLASKKAEAEVVAAQENYDLFINKYDTIRQKISSLNQEIFSMYSTYGKLEGGFAEIQYNSGWQDNVSKLSLENQGLKFNSIPTKNARLHANLIGSTDQSSYLASLPAVLDYQMAGLKYQPWGEEKTPELSSLPDNIQGSLRLSLIGGCPAHYENFLGDDLLKVREPQSSSFPIFGITATYEYPVSYHLKMKASYNLYKMYEETKKSGTSGGFFTSRSYVDASTKKLDKDTFSIDWTVEDPNSQYSEEKRFQVEREIRQILLERVLSNMAQPIFTGATAQPEAAPAIPENGAMVLAEGISRTCGWYSFYCTGGSWLLKGANAIFGSSSSESSFKAEHNSNATEEWNVTAASWKSGAISYK
jgi:hypothetical protein